jgi:protease II
VLSHLEAETSHASRFMSHLEPLITQLVDEMASHTPEHEAGAPYKGPHVGDPHTYQRRCANSTDALTDPAWRLPWLAHPCLLVRALSAVAVGA